MVKLALRAARPVINPWRKSFPDTTLYECQDGALHGMPGRAISISLADANREHKQAETILNRAYGKRGYGSGHQIARGRHSVTFTASADGAMIGTITLSVDSPRGLSIQSTFGAELDRLRAAGGKLCELTKFAFDPRPDSRPLLAALFHIIYLYGTERFDCSDLLIEVNPRHVKFYEVMLGFTKLGALRTNNAVGAPAQLLHLPVAEIGVNIGKLASGGHFSAHTLYRDFFDPCREAELRARIEDLVHGDGNGHRPVAPRQRRFGSIRLLIERALLEVRQEKRVAA